MCEARTEKKKGRQREKKRKNEGRSERSEEVSSNMLEEVRTKKYFERSDNDKAKNKKKFEVRSMKHKVLNTQDKVQDTMYKSLLLKHEAHQST